MKSSPAKSPHGSSANRANDDDHEGPEDAGTSETTFVAKAWRRSETRQAAHSPVDALGERFPMHTLFRKG
jgi:hypothetical protein